MATNEKPVYTGIDKIDHFNQRHLQNEERERAMRMMLEEQAREAAELEEVNQFSSKEMTRRTQASIGNPMESVPKEDSKIFKSTSVGSTKVGFTSFGVAALLAAMATEQLGRTVSRNPASKRTGKVRPHDGKVKRSTLTREDFPSRQAWRAHQREQKKAQDKGQLYDY